MNARAKWKQAYQAWKIAIQCNTFYESDAEGEMMLRYRREAALERTIEAQARTIEAARWQKDVE